MKDYYYILGIDKNATKEDIKKAYKKLSLKLHPDQNNGDKFFEDRFKEVNEAYETLTNDNKRKLYDLNFTNPNSKFESTNTTKPNHSEPKQEEFDSNPQFDKKEFTNDTKPKSYKRVWNFAFILVAILILSFIKTVVSKSIKDNAIEKYNEELQSKKSEDLKIDTSVVVTSEISTQIDTSSYHIDTTAVINAKDSISNISPPLQDISSNPFVSYTEEQTEKWILDKMNAYSRAYLNYSDYEFNFKDGYFIVADLEESKNDEVTYIPIFDINKVTDEYDHLSFATNKSTIYNERLSDKYKITKSNFSIGFQTNAETESVKQIEAAFFHLKSLHPNEITTQLPSFVPKRVLEKPSFEETKAWLLTKLNSYSLTYISVVEQSTWSCKNFKYYFDNGNNLVASYDEEIYVHSPISSHSIYNYIVSIPLCNVELKNPNYSQNTIGAPNVNLQFYSASSRIQLQSNQNYQSGTRDRFEIKMDFTKEDGLYVRFKKAFYNLKSYCSTKKNNETF